jgi:hypothetical protein
MTVVTLLRIPLTEPKILRPNLFGSSNVYTGMDDLDQAVVSLLAVRGIERMARDLAKTPDQADIAVRYAKDVIDAIERFVNYMVITSRTSITPN